MTKIRIGINLKVHGFNRKMDNGESTKKLKWTKPFGIYFLKIKTK